MIDLSYLTEEEQEMIMAVLKRDSELKKSEEDRIKHLQNVVPEEDRRKNMTGEWFYEVKSQRHQDRIHGSDVIMASMKQQKPTLDDYLTRSWSERSRSLNIKNSDSISEKPNERENSGTSENLQERLNRVVRSPSKTRHNPFNSIPMELNLEETPESSGSGLRRSSTDRDFDSQVKYQEPSHTEDNSEVPRIKPVPKKRTRIFKPQSSLSDSASSVSTQSASSQSVSTQSISTRSTSTQSVSATESSGTQTPAPRGILKYTSSCSSSDSAFKSQMPQPVVTLSYVRKRSNQEKDFDKSKHILESKEEPGNKTQPLKIPKSRLPVRAPSLLKKPPQDTEEKTKMQTRLSLSSNPTADNDMKEQYSMKQKRTDDCFFQSPNIEPDDQKMLDETFYFPHENSRSAITTNSMKPIDVIIAPQRTHQKSETVENHMTMSQKVETTRAEHIRTAVDQQFPCVADIAHTSSDRGIESSPSAFNINTYNTNQESKPAVATDAHIPKPTDERGNSITKVLEWFSRSSDSSDMLDVESNHDMEEDTKIDDLYVEDEANKKPKPRDNVYLIIPRQSEKKSSEVNSQFLKDTDWGKEPCVDESPQNTPKQRRRSESMSYKESLIMKTSVDVAMTDFTNDVTQPEDSVFEKVNENEPIDSLTKGDLREEPKVKLETDFKVHQQKERMGGDENQRPKLAHLRSFWERENIGPKILISRSNVPAKNESLNTSDVCTKPVEIKNVAEHSLGYPEHQIKETISVVDVSDLKNAKTIKKPQVPVVTAESKNASLIYANQKKDETLASSPSDKQSSLPRLKSSSLLDSGSLSAGQNIERMGGSNGDCTSQKESEPKSKTAPRPNPMPLVKQNSQQQETMAVKIKQLKSFWEKEKWEPRISAQNRTPSVASAKMNKRFTKSEFDLRLIGAEFDDDIEDDTSDREKVSPNFAMHPLWKERSSVTDGMNNSQFKNLRDFWGGSPTMQSGQKSPVLKSGNKNQKVYNFQSEKSNVKTVVNETQTNAKQSLADSSPAKPEKTPLSSSNKKSTKRQESVAKTKQLPSASSQTSVKDTTPHKPTIGQESRPQQSRSSSKGSLNGKAKAMRRVSSMFSVNTAGEEQSQSVHPQPKEPQNPNLYQATKSYLTPSRKTTESSNTLPKTSSENSWQDKERNSQRKPSCTSEDSDFQPLARSYIPPDYQHYLGITETGRMYTPPPVIEQIEDFLCTSFTTSMETSCKCKCSPVRTSTPVQGSPDLQRRGSLGLDGHVCHDGSETSTADTWPHAKGNLNCANESSVQKALRRAASRPMYHKSMNDISTSPGQGQNIKQTDDYEQVPSTHVQTSFATSDPEHLKQLSKSVPSFLQKESDGGESDSESSSRSGLPQRINRQYTNLSGYSGSASVSSVSGSVASVYSSDYGSVEVQGIIQFSLNYVQKLREFHIFVVQCKNLAAVDPKRNRSDPYVKSYLIPDSANLGKRKTSVKRKTLNPTYNEILRYRVRMENLKSQLLNLSVWHNDTFGRNNFLGETELDLSLWDFNDTERKFLPLKPRRRLKVSNYFKKWTRSITHDTATLVDPMNYSFQSSTSLQPLDFRGQMKLAVRFLPQISQSKRIPGTGEVHIWAKDCKNLPLIRSPSIDPFIKCFVLPDTSKKSRQKTRVLKKTTSPIFNHTMVYDGFRAEDLKEACVEITVWDRDRLANHLLGGLRLGMGTGKSYGAQVNWMDSTPEEIDLWRRMMESPSEWIEGVLPLRMLTTDNKA